jgi:hypothetical protein
LEIRVVRPSREIRWRIIGGAVLRDESGRIVRFKGFTYNVTDWKVSEETLQGANLKPGNSWKHAPKNAKRLWRNFMQLKWTRLVSWAAVLHTTLRTCLP